MPNVNGQKFPYTAKGKKDAKIAASGGGMADSTSAAPSISPKGAKFIKAIMGRNKAGEGKLMPKGKPAIKPA